MKNSSPAIVLFAHGSRQPSWRAPFDQMLEQLRRERPDARVALAFLELMTPSLPDVLRDLAADGVAQIAIVPVFFGVGNHVARDLTEQVDAFKAEQPSIQITIAPAVGQSSLVLDAMVKHASACAVVRA